MNINEMLAALPSMSKKELQLIQAAADQLLSKVRGPKSNQEIFDLLRTRLGVVISDDRFDGTELFKQWQKKSPTVVSFIEHAFPLAKQTKISKMVVTAHLIDILIADMKEHNVPVTLSSVIHNLERVPEVFDVAYPGYVAAGLTSLVYEALVGKGAKRRVRG